MLGKLTVPGRLTNLDESRTVGAGGGYLEIYSLVYHFSFLSPSLGDSPI